MFLRVCDPQQGRSSAVLDGWRFTIPGRLKAGTAYFGFAPLDFAPFGFAQGRRDRKDKCRAPTTLGRLEHKQESRQDGGATKVP